MHRIVLARHVGPFRDGDHAVLRENLCIVERDLVLRRAREGEVAVHAPWSLSGVERRFLVFPRVLLDASAPHFLEVLQPLELLGRDAVRIVNEPARVRCGDDARSEMDELLDGVERDVARSRDERRFPFDAFILRPLKKLQFKCR